MEEEKKNWSSCTMNEKFWKIFVWVVHKHKLNLGKWHLLSTSGIWIPFARFSWFLSSQTKSVFSHCAFVRVNRLLPVPSVPVIKITFQRQPMCSTTIQQPNRKQDSIEKRKKEKVSFFTDFYSTFFAFSQENNMTIGMSYGVRGRWATRLYLLQ